MRRHPRKYASSPGMSNRSPSETYLLTGRVPFVNGDVSIELRIRDRLRAGAGPMDFYCQTCARVSQTSDDSRIARGQIAAGGRDISDLEPVTSVRNDYPRAQAVAI